MNLSPEHEEFLSIEFMKRRSVEAETLYEALRDNHELTLSLLAESWPKLLDAVVTALAMNALPPHLRHVMIPDGDSIGMESISTETALRVMLQQVVLWTSLHHDHPIPEPDTFAAFGQPQDPRRDLH